MTYYKNIEQLKDNSIRITNGMNAVFPQFSLKEAINVSKLIPKFPDCYAMNNSTVAFVHENNFYVTPYTRSAIAILSSKGFSEERFYVPFSNCDYPEMELNKWERLREMAHQSAKADFVSDCEAYCDECHINSISQETLANCFEIPEEGVRVKHHVYEDTYYPVMNQRFLDYRYKYLGHFCSNNGRVVFVYRNGKTYVAKGYKIIDELEAAGYTQSRIFVPFSNGEVILDNELRVRWEMLSK